MTNYLTDEMITEAINLSLKHSSDNNFYTAIIGGIVGFFILIYFGRDFILSLKRKKTPLSFITYIFWFALASFFIFISFISWDNYINPNESTDYYVVETKITRIDHDEDGGYYIYFQNVNISMNQAITVIMI